MRLTLASRAAFSLKPKKPLLGLNLSKNKPNYSAIKNARTRFAPSPTGFIHLGSLRTALYNYLLAKSTGGQFLLRLEDTDQKRLVPGAEENIYKSLRWAGLNWDEGPLVGGPYGPYRQSERSDIYATYSDSLLQSGKAYRCFCSKERLDTLAESARRLRPPSLASYDRKCAHLSQEESDDKAHKGEQFIVRLKSPNAYPDFTDILHGKVHMQPQTNSYDPRFDDPVLVKSDGLPTYHYANVIDDHLMKISHVIRGEEWLGSTPKHMYLYEAFGWTPPQYAHIPLLTSLSDQKLSKRKGDSSILALAAEKNILPEALVNFVALFGWSPERPVSGVSMAETMTLDELVGKFSLNGLTKGNAKVDTTKLTFMNAYFFKKRLQDPKQRQDIVDQAHQRVLVEFKDRESDIPDETRLRLAYTERLLGEFAGSVQSIPQFLEKAAPFYSLPPLVNKDKLATGEKIYKEFLSLIKRSKHVNEKTLSEATAAELCDALVETTQVSKKEVYKTLRHALTGGKAGLSIPKTINLFDVSILESRLKRNM